MRIIRYELKSGNKKKPGYDIAKALAMACTKHFDTHRSAEENVRERKRLKPGQDPYITKKMSTGIGPASCCAAIAIMEDEGKGFKRRRANSAPSTSSSSSSRPRAAAAAAAGGGGGGGMPQDTTELFGNSQFKTRKGEYINLERVDGHAEIAAIRAVIKSDLNIYFLPNKDKEAVIYIELSPCKPCRDKLTNDTLGLFTGMRAENKPKILHVWYLYEYKDDSSHNATLVKFHKLKIPKQEAEIQKR